MVISVVPFLIALAGINAFTLLSYWADKHYARNGSWRVPESTLLMLALLGGSPAAFYAMRRFRHKTRKSSFRARFWLMVIIQVIIALYATLFAANPVRFVLA